MSEVEEITIDDLPVIDGELIEVSRSADKNSAKNEIRKPNTEITTGANRAAKTDGRLKNNQSAIRSYLLAPAIFLTVTLLGGLRLSENANDFIFLKPPLVCLVFAAATLALFFRAELIKIGGWFSESFSTVKNIADAFVLFALFAASAQIFNALLPERGLPFWIIGLLFFWTLWNNLFGVFTAKTLIKSLGGLFGLAFVLKYLILANLTAPTNGGGWLKSLTENPTQEVFTYLLDLPRYSAGTGYIQFFTVVFYVVGLFLLSPDMKDEKELGRG